VDTDPAGSHSDPVREEAERLVTAAITGLSLAVRSIPGVAEHTFANESPECCICPICRVITAMRDPSPELTERLAGGVGDIAAAIAHALRGLAMERDQPAPTPGRTDHTWRDATRRGTAGDPTRRSTARDATRPDAAWDAPLDEVAQGGATTEGAARDDAWPEAGVPVGNRPGPAAAPRSRAPVAKVAKKAVAKKAVAKTEQRKPSSASDRSEE
jgi:hypothetical protein